MFAGRACAPWVGGSSTALNRRSLLWFDSQGTEDHCERATSSCDSNRRDKRGFRSCLIKLVGIGQFGHFLFV